MELRGYNNLAKWEREVALGQAKGRPYGFSISKYRLHSGLYGLSPVEKVVFLDLCLYRDRQGHCWPSYRTLAANLGLNIKTIQKTIKSLEQKGFLRIEKRWGEKGKAFGYWLKNLVVK